jgi:hypothetical protein
MTADEEAQEPRPRPPVFRGRRSVARAVELEKRDRLARVLGFVVGVGATAVFVFRKPRTRASRWLIPALVKVSPVVAWCVLALATLAFACALLRVASDDLWKSWLMILMATYASAWILRLLLLLAA